MINSTLRKFKSYGFASLIICLFLLFSTNHYALAQDKANGVNSSAAIDALLLKMSTREKIAQLFIVAFSSDMKDKSTIEALNLIKNEKIGGVIVMNTPLTPGAEMINYLQSNSKIPLLVTLDGEWGASMRFDSVVAFPRQMQLGALQSDSLIFKLGYAVGEQTKRLGIDVNFAPSIDVNNNPANPVINTRSFGEDKYLVAKYGLAYMRGMQEAGVPGSAKHFPGHGDTDTDSHLSLPLISFSKERIDSLELYPFRKLIEAGVDMVMVGHLQIPSLDSSGRPSSISHPIVTDLLRRELEYNGLIITDALNMKGVATFMVPEFLPLEAYKAGSDLILMPENVKEAINIMEKAVEREEISIHSLNIRAKKMLMLKMKLGILPYRDAVSTNKLYEDLNKEEYNSLITKIAENSITLLENRDNNLPILNLTNQNIGYLSLGGDKNAKE
ncbi:MAG: glycoside hydrolase family 3 N-terminal domain-containing protein, partial [Bacteroidales bacterium]